MWYLVIVKAVIPTFVATTVTVNIFLVSTWIFRKVPMTVWSASLFPLDCTAMKVVLQIVIGGFYGKQKGSGLFFLEALITVMIDTQV